MPVIARFIYHKNPDRQQPDNLAMLSLCQPIRQTRQPLFVFLIHLTDIRRIAKRSGGGIPLPSLKGKSLPCHAHVNAPIHTAYKWIQ